MSSVAIIVVLVVIVIVIVLVCLLSAVWWLVSRRRNKNAAGSQAAEPIVAPSDRTTPAVTPESQLEAELMAPAEAELEAPPLKETVAGDAFPETVEEPEMPETSTGTVPATDPAAAIYDLPESVVAAESLAADPEPELDLSPSTDMVEPSRPTHRSDLL